MKPSYSNPPRPSSSTQGQPSLAQASYSSSGSSRSSVSAPGTADHWQESDIRGDVAAGWGSSRARGPAGDTGAGYASVPHGHYAENAVHPSHEMTDWGWSLNAQAVRPLPPFYPLDPRSTRRLFLTKDWADNGNAGGLGRTGGITTVQEVKEEELAQTVGELVDDATGLLQRLEGASEDDSVKMEAQSLQVDMKMLKMDAGMIQTDKELVGGMSERWMEVNAKMRAVLEKNQGDLKGAIMEEWADVDEKLKRLLEECKVESTSSETSSTPQSFLASVAASVSSPVNAPSVTSCDITSGVQQHSVKDISKRISSACQHLSIQADWDNACPSATLFSMERVEMVLSMYLGSLDDGLCMMGGRRQAIPSQQTAPQVLLVEVQRRKGCTVTFHNYRRFLLDAAEGKFHPETFHQFDGLDKPSGRDRCNQPRASLQSKSQLSRPQLAKPSLKSSPSGSGLARPPRLGHPNRPPSFSADDAAVFATLKSEGDSSFESGASEGGIIGEQAQNDIVDKALVALNIAASLIKKDRVDARRLGIESLVLLTDPLRAGVETAEIASRVVLLGTAREDIDLNAMGDFGFGHEDDMDALFDESAGLGIRESILEMIMGDDIAGKLSDDEHSHDGIDKEFHDSFFNSCLSVLSNALNTLAGSGCQGISSPSTPLLGIEDDDEEDDRKPTPSNRRRAATAPAIPPSSMSKRFIDDTNSTFGVDVLSSLIRILGQAKSSPHDAYHSARCLGVLFKGCGNSHKARARRDLDAKRIISAALEVGARSHAKLADASRAAMVALVTDDEDSVEEESKVELDFHEERREAGEIGVQQDTEMETEEQQQVQHQPPLPYFPPSPDVL